MVSVKADTILKWIKSGKLRATRTAGGHHRVDSQDLRQCLESVAADNGQGQCQRCWEYLARGAPVREACRECIVFRARAGRCFELRRTAPELPQAGVFCLESCEDCAYYQRVTGRTLRVLVVSRSESLAAELAVRPAGVATFKLARNGYEASALIGAFRPSFAVVDAQGVSDVTSLVRCLLEDPRVPGLQVFCTAGGNTMPPGVAAIKEPLSAEGVERALRSVPVETHVV
jgi:excisionase family DNA binding protein